VKRGHGNHQDYTKLSPLTTRSTSVDRPDAAVVIDATGAAVGVLLDDTVVEFDPVVYAVNNEYEQQQIYNN